MTTATAHSLLQVKHLDVHYGPIQVLHGVSLEVRRGELVCLIGANGAGKSTLLKSIMGLVPPTGGQVFFNQQEITRCPTHRHSAQGLSLVPEGRGIFPAMSVQENLLMGAWSRRHSKDIPVDLDHAYKLFPRLAERRRQLAGTLSGGEQQMLAIARALLAKPQLLLLDEPSMGLAPLLVQKIFDVIADIHQQGVSILLIEQNAHGALQLAERAYVMEHGHIVLQGNSATLANDPAIQSAYLGL